MPVKPTQLDPALVGEVLTSFDKLISATLSAGGGDKYGLVVKLATQASNMSRLARTVGMRVADHLPQGQAQVAAGAITLTNTVMGANINGLDGDVDGEVYGDDVTANYGQLYGGVVQGRRQLGQEDIIREIVSAIGPLAEVLVKKEKTVERGAKSGELANLMDAREKLLAATGMEQPEKDRLLVKIDERVKVLVDGVSAPEERDDGTAVVPAKLLRGHQPDGRVEGQGQEDEGVLGTPLDDRAEGPHQPA